MIHGVNLPYEGLVPKVQKSFLSKDPDALQPHIRAFVDRAVTFTACSECGGTRLSEAARSSRIGGVQIPHACAMQIPAPAARGPGAHQTPGAPLLATPRPKLLTLAPIAPGPPSPPPPRTTPPPLA